jgi:hypothetical protein
MKVLNLLKQIELTVFFPIQHPKPTQQKPPEPPPPPLLLDLPKGHHTSSDHILSLFLNLTRLHLRPNPKAVPSS